MRHVRINKEHQGCLKVYFRILGSIENIVARGISLDQMKKSKWN